MTADFNSEFLIQSPFYSRVMNDTVLPWLSDRACETTVISSDGHPLYCVSYEAEQPVGTVLIVHGFTENAYKYAELIWSLLHLGFSVLAYDQRGHGRSWRAENIPDISVTHVDHFSDYVEDLQTVCQSFRDKLPAPWFLFAHSMGGAVASLFLEQGGHGIKAAVFSSPMIAPSVRPFPAFLASALSFCGCMLGKGKHPPFFMKTYSGPEDFATSCATDPERFAWYDAVKASVPEFRNSIPSYRWSGEAIRVTRRILSKGAPERITCPVILFSAGIDFSVLREPQEAFIRRLPDGQFVPVPDARHEIFRSVNEVLFPWWHQVILFLQEHLA